MKLLCIDDDFSTIENEVLKKLYAENRDEYFPKKGLVYEVARHKYRKGVECYTFKELKDTSETGVTLFFLGRRFVVVDTTLNNGGKENLGIIEMEISFTWDKNLLKDIPKEGVTFVHDGLTDKKEEEENGG